MIGLRALSKHCGAVNVLDTSWSDADIVGLSIIGASLRIGQSCLQLMSPMFASASVMLEGMNVAAVEYALAVSLTQTTG